MNNKIKDNLKNLELDNFEWPYMDTPEDKFIKIYTEGLAKAEQVVMDSLLKYRKENNLTEKDANYNGPFYSRWTALKIVGKKSDKFLKSLEKLGIVSHDEYWGYTMSGKYKPNFDKGSQSAILDEIGYNILKKHLEKNTDMNFTICERDL